MSRDIQVLALGTFAPMLRNLSTWLDRAAADADDPAALPRARLAPDMYDLAQQVDLASRHAVDGVARLTGRPPPAPGEAPGALPELKALIARALATLEATPPSAFAGAEDREIRFPAVEGLEFRFAGERFLRDWALPHFYFHLVTAYDILRSRGAQIGKRDYLAQVADAIGPPGAP